MNEAIQKKNVYISEKYIKNSFVLMGFKNNIRQMAAVVGNTLLKTFPEVLHHFPGHLRRNAVDFLSDPSFKSSRYRGRCLKTFSFRYPQRKKSHGLKSRDHAGHPTSPLKEIKRPGKCSLGVLSGIFFSVWIQLPEGQKSIAKSFSDLVQMRFDRARSVYRTLSASLSQNGCSRNTLEQSPDVHRSNS